MVSLEFSCLGVNAQCFRASPSPLLLQTQQPGETQVGEAGRTSWEQGCEASRSVCGSPGPHWHCVRCLFLLLQTLVTVYTVPAGDGTGPASTAVAPELPHYPWSQGPLDPGELEFWTSWSPHTGPGGPAILGLTRHPPPTHVVPPASHLPPTLVSGPSALMP